MRLTKVDGVYHTKEKLETDKTIGKLVKKRGAKTRDIVKNRISIQIESRIYKEFFTLKGNRINNKNKFFVLFLFLKKLYLNVLNQKKSLEINIDVKKLKNLNIEELEKNNELIKRYKLNKDNYLVKLENGENSKSFLEMFLDVQNEIKIGDELTKLQSYKELQKVFDIYVNRKMDYIVKSLENNKIFVKNKNKNLEILEPNIKTKFYLELIEKCKKETNEDLFEKEINKFLCGVNKQVKKIIEILNKENLEVMKKRREILEEVREKNEEFEIEYNYEKIWDGLLKEELKLIVTNVTSISKKEFKERNGKKKENMELYFNYLKKELGDEKKLEIKIKENFKNRFVSRILEYGKYLHYLENKVVTSKELEFIKAKESLNSKFATIMSFAIHTYNKFSRDGISYEVLREKIGEEFSIFDVKDIDLKKVEYFFGEIKNYNVEEKKFFIKALHNSLYNYRLQVAHFNRKIKPEIDKEKYRGAINITFNEEDTKVTYNYLKSAEKEIEKNLKKKFDSNNLEYYYDDEEIEKYFNLYQCELLKTKVPYAPNFKRIIEKGEKLYQYNEEKYKYFFIFKDKYKISTEEDKKAYLNAKNYLLKELYYNNFFKEFLDENNNYFFNAIENAKNRKSDNGKNKKTAYKQFENYKIGNSISEYVANIHKLEMNKLADEKYLNSKKKDKSKYINEYLEDIFLEGFISWLGEKDLMFLTKCEKIIREKQKAEIEYKIKLKTGLKIDVNKKEKKELMIFLILSLVDDKRISEFANELLKYKQYLEKRTEKEFEFLGTNINVWREICELVLLTRERLSLKEEDIKRRKKGENNHLIEKYYGDRNKYFEIIKKFVENDVFEESKKIEDEEEILYLNTDGETPILYGNLEKTRKFGLNNLIENMKYKKYSKDERDEYKGKNIENLQKKKLKLHEKWEKGGKIDFEEYKSICECIRRYDYLRKKQTMYIPFQLHEIASDIQARFLGYIVKQERDFEFFKLCFNIKEYGKTKEEIDRMYGENHILNIFNKEAYEIRNYIAHFHHYIDEGGKATWSFIDQMNMMIKFLAYDRKNKNQINKSIKTILEKYNIEIEFERKDNEDGSYSYIIKSIKSKKGKILGKKNKFEILEKEFVDEVRKLLEYKK